MYRNDASELTRIKALALEETVDAVIITDRNGVVLWHNSAFTRLTGYTFEETVDRTLGFLKSGEHDELFYRDLWQTILSGGSWRGELVNRRKDGRLYVEEQTITPVKGSNGEITHFIAIKHDITERKRQQEQLEYLATHDALTKLPNRRVVEDALERAVARGDKEVSGALAFLDIDNLKLINDSLGHVAGDEVLKALAARLKAALRPRDLLARVAGDEFVILFEGIGVKESRNRLGHIRRSVSEKPLYIHNKPLYMTVSIGLVPVVPGMSVRQLVSRADSAMYEAKRRGGNRIEIGDLSTSYLDETEARFRPGRRVTSFPSVKSIAVVSLSTYHES